MRRRRFIVALLVMALVLSNVVLAYAAPTERSTEGNPSFDAVVYVVQSGDTLSGIASRYGVTTAALMQANGLANANLVVVGQRLTIPGRSTGSTGSAAGGSVYTVQSGDSLGAIAAHYGTTVQSLMALNGLSNGSLIYVGQSLRVNGSVPAAAGSSSGSTVSSSVYTVRAGDSLSGIASRYGTSVAAIMSANGLRSASLILIGQRLRIPAGGAGGSGSVPAYQGGGSNLRFVVDISSQRCQLYAGTQLLNAWRCSTGRKGSGTKAGSFRVQSKIRNAWGSRWNFWMPYWLGIYWAGSTENGIHGQPWYPSGGQVWAGLVGTPITFGCVMLDNGAAAALYNVAYIGMPVTIRY